ncbi:hypothetical protein P5673_019407 [Acropora cervicornis]|uniref:Uncharacterized protein n=1 Tax=Acropora cervicornis TaxID=6130 RepID=A0AAD9QBQ2_ACRCE|nr:hypothetical protein P5673_019407 [Acropora cervicornis]
MKSGAHSSVACNSSCTSRHRWLHSGNKNRILGSNDAKLNCTGIPPHSRLFIGYELNFPANLGNGSEVSPASSDWHDDIKDDSVNDSSPYLLGQRFCSSSTEGPCLSLRIKSEENFAPFDHRLKVSNLLDCGSYLGDLSTLIQCIAPFDGGMAHNKRPQKATANTSNREATIAIKEMKTYSVSARDNGKSSNLRKSYNESNFADRTSSSTVNPVITTKRWIQSKAVSSQKLGLTNVLSNNRTKLKVFLNSFFGKLHKIFMKFNAMINTLSLENS